MNVLDFIVDLYPMILL